MVGRSRESTGNGHALRTLQQAHALFRARRFDEALRLFGEATRVHRWEPGVLIEAARAFAARYQPARADALLTRALRIAGSRADVQCLVGECYRAQGRFDIADQCFRRALALTEKAPRAELELAYVCERTHRLDESRSLCDRILTREPKCGSAIVLKARVLRRLRVYDEAERVLVSPLINVPDSKLAAEAWGELALILDETRRYDEAWEAIGRCKRIQLLCDTAEWHAAQHVAARFGRMAAELTADHFRRWRFHESSGGDQIPLALLTGFPRSGTTLLERVLEAHPRVIPMEEKDILAGEVFPYLTRESHESSVCELLDAASEPKLATARRMYLDFATSFVGERRSEAVLLDKNPALTLMIPVYVRLFPRARLLLALRDPRDVVVSCYLRYLPLNPVSVSFLTPERTAGRYTADMSAWIRYREWLSDICSEVRYEDVVRDLRREAERSLQTLGLPWEESVMSYRDRPQLRAILSPTYDAVDRPVYQTAVGRWRNYARFLEPLRDLLDPIAHALGYD